MRSLYVCLFCCSGRVPRQSLNQHSLYVGVVEEPPPPPLTGEQFGKMEPKYPEGGHCQSVLRPQGVVNVPLYFKRVFVFKSSFLFRSTGQSEDGQLLTPVTRIRLNYFQLGQKTPALDITTVFFI